MSSSISCKCGRRLEKNLFSGHDIQLLIGESFLDRDLANRSAQELVHELIVDCGLLLNCDACGRICVVDETGQREPRSYRPDPIER